jgi:putative transposase
MELSPEEQERKESIQSYLEGSRPVDIYRHIKKSKKWFNKWLKRYQTGQNDWYKDLPRKHENLHNRTDNKIELVIVKIRKSLMNGIDESSRYSFVGAEAIKFKLEELGYKPSEIPSLSTIKRIIKRNKLLVYVKERYKRVKSKGRHTIIKPTSIDEMHQMDFVGPRYIKGFGNINSLHLKDVVGRQVSGNQYIEKSMDNVLSFLLDYWKSHPIPKYLQVDNGMSFVGDYKHQRSFSRFVRMCLYVGIEVIFIAPAKPWMNGTVERFNKEFDRLFWRRENFTNLSDIREKFKVFNENQNKFYQSKLKFENLNSITPNRMLGSDFEINLNNIPLVSGKIHFIRVVDCDGNIILLNERFHVGGEYIGDYTWQTVDTREQVIIMSYNDENMVVREIKQLKYTIDEMVQDLSRNIFRPYKLRALRKKV